MRNETRSLEERLRQKHSIGDWFFVTSFVVLILVVALNSAKDQTISKAISTFEHMLPKKP